MNIIICVLLLVILLYVIYYHHNFKTYETFQNNTTLNNQSINNQNLNNKNSDIKLDDTVDDGIKNFINQLEMVKNKIPDVNSITQDDFKQSDNFISHVITNFDKINQAQKNNFDEKHQGYAKKINDLKNKINGFRDALELESGRDTKLINSIISNQNGQPMTVIPVSNDKHVVIVNNKCLSTNSVGKYDLKYCNYLDPEQHFILNPVYHDIDYNSKLAPYVKKVNGGVDKDNENIKYPFVIVKSDLNENCLGNEDGKIFISHCQSEKGQRWFPSTKLYKCS